MALVKVAQKAGVMVLRDSGTNAPFKTFDYDTDIAPLAGVAVVEVAFVFFTYAAGGTGSAREMVVDVLDSANNIVLRVPAGITTDLSTTRAYSFADKGAGATSFPVATGAASVISTEILPSGIFLCSGLKLRVGAAENSDAADDLDVYLHLRTLYGNT